MNVLGEYREDVSYFAVFGPSDIFLELLSVLSMKLCFFVVVVTLRQCYCVYVNCS